jgi:hypothetical protein
MGISGKLSVTGSLLILLLSLPLAAQVAVYSPANGSSVQSPFTLSASAYICSSETVAAIGYSLDSSPDFTRTSGTSLDATVAASAGAHTINVMAWGDYGSVCVATVSVTVTPASTGGSGPVPSNAVSVSALQALSNWKAIHDTGGKGNAKGWTGIVSSPSLSGSAREFTTSFKSDGDERYSVGFADDQTSTNFFYDGWVYIAGSSADVGNLEMDLNQTMANGQTVTFGVQCDGWFGTWDYALNAGTPRHEKDTWAHTKSPCNPRSWSTDTWHHVQISYSRDDVGNVNYQSVWLDGVEQGLNATVPSAAILGWGPLLVTNFQVDGFHGSGSSNVYLDNLVVYRW